MTDSETSDTYSEACSSPQTTELGRRFDRALNSFADGLWWGMLTVLAIEWWRDRRRNVRKR